MRPEAERWLKQAEADFRAAKASLEAGHFEWACFQAQQSAEKALKAFLYGRGMTSIMTHSLTELVQECQKLDKTLGALAEPARFLDFFYIPTRYPNGLAGSMAPAEFYQKEDAQKCISSCESILTVCRSITGG